MISMPRWQQIKSFSAINRTKESRVQEINCVCGFRVSIDFTEVPRALSKPTLVVYTGPMLAGVIGAVKPAFLRLDDCVNAVGIRTRNGDADLTKDSFGKAVTLEMFPRDAIIFRPIKSAACTAAGEKPRLSARLPKRCEDDVRVMRIKDNIDPAGVLVFGQNFRPRFSAVGRPENSAFLTWTKRVAERCGQDDVLISWIDDQCPDLTAVF